MLAALLDHDRLRANVRWSPPWDVRGFRGPIDLHALRIPQSVHSVGSPDDAANRGIPVSPCPENAPFAGRYRDNVGIIGEVSRHRRCSCGGVQRDEQTMATISNVTLAISDYNSLTGTVKLTFKYRLTPSAVEKMAGTVYKEQLSLLGRDYAIPLPLPVEAERADILLPTRDSTIRTFNGGMFAASPSTPAIDRQFVVTVAKSILNEDPELSSTGSETSDEVLSKVMVTMIANLPVGAGPIPPGFSSVVSGTWT